MKKVILLSVLMACAFTINAQTSFGIFGGPQMTSAKYTVNGQKQPTSYKTGFHLGGACKIPFDNQLYFTPAIFYSLKGYKVTLNQRSYPPDSLAVDNNTTIHTVELAFLLQYELGKKPDHFFIKAGPSIDIQLSGNEKFHTTNSSYVDQKMKFDFGAYGHFGASILLQLGYETRNGLFVYGQYTDGIGSINNADHGPKILHRVWGLSIGKYLGKKKNG